MKLQYHPYVLHFCIISFMFLFWRPQSSSSTALVILEFTFSLKNRYMNIKVPLTCREFFKEQISHHCMHLQVNSCLQAFLFQFCSNLKSVSYILCEGFWLKKTLRPILIESKNWVAKLTPNFFLKLCPLPIIIEATKNSAFFWVLWDVTPCFRVNSKYSDYYSIVHGVSNTGVNLMISLSTSMVPTALKKKTPAKRFESLKFVGGSKFMKELQKTVFFAA